MRGSADVGMHDGAARRMGHRPILFAFCKGELHPKRSERWSMIMYPMQCLSSKKPKKIKKPNIETAVACGG